MSGGATVCGRQELTARYVRSFSLVHSPPPPPRRGIMINLARGARGRAVKRFTRGPRSRAKPFKHSDQREISPMNFAARSLAAAPRAKLGRKLRARERERNRRVFPSFPTSCARGGASGRFGVAGVVLGCWAGEWFDARGGARATADEAAVRRNMRLAVARMFFLLTS